MSANCTPPQIDRSGDSSWSRKFSSVFWSSVVTSWTSLNSLVDVDVDLVELEVGEVESFKTLSRRASSVFLRVPDPRRFLRLNWLRMILGETPHPQIPSCKQNSVSVCAIGPDHRSSHYAATEPLRRLWTPLHSEITEIPCRWSPDYTDPRNSSANFDESTDRLELVEFVVEVEGVLEVALRRARAFVLMT